MTEDGRQDRIHWIKNLIQLMCCDGNIADREKKFLFKAARQLGVEVADWNALLKSVLHDARVRYPISDETSARAALKSLIVMANADGKIDDNEKRYILNFAKVIGVSNTQLKEMIKDIDARHRPASQAAPRVFTAARDDFDQIEQFVEVVGEQGHEIRVVTIEDLTAGKHTAGDILCFHAVGQPADTVERYKRLLDTTSGLIVAILTRYQGHHVRYLLELGIAKCVVEPVYARDVEQIFALVSA
ncbi:MAG: hypothetical protein IH624_04310 [Phycisphaerae bacterium]|nr:hypothetical protein [Phycisphaerae bacterium]